MSLNPNILIHHSIFLIIIIIICLKYHTTQQKQDQEFIVSVHYFHDSYSSKDFRSNGLHNESGGIQYVIDSFCYGSEHKKWYHTHFTYYSRYCVHSLDSLFFCTSSQSVSPSYFSQLP